MPGAIVGLVGAAVRTAAPSLIGGLFSSGGEEKTKEKSDEKKNEPSIMDAIPPIKLLMK